MDPDKGFLAVSEEKKNKKKHDFLFVGGKKVLHIFTSEKKKDNRKKRVNFNKNGYLFGKYSLHIGCAKQSDFSICIRYVVDTFNNFELWNVTEQERKKTDELTFHVGGKNKKNPEKSTFFSCRAWFHHIGGIVDQRIYWVSP